MKILVIGGGIIGVTTAHFLVRRGHEVTVIDRCAGAALETSFANGGLLTASMADPWNTPGCWRVLLSSLGRSDSPMQLRLKALPALARWGLTFLKNSQPAAFERNARANLRLALYSLEVLYSLLQQTPLQYGGARRGALRVFRDSASLEVASETARGSSSEGVSSRRLSREETVALEPALSPIADQLTGALHYATDETGDAHRFCVALADHARQLGVQFRFGRTVSALQLRSGRVVAAVVGQREHFVADRYVLAAGSYSGLLSRQVGVRLPIQPVKGYSLTVDSPPNQDSLRIPVIDDQRHAVVVPLGDIIRVAGTAEFGGYDRTENPDRVRNLGRLLKDILPQLHYDPTTARPWCGLRSMSADGVPIIGSTSVPNLLVNTGHGHLGWTMATGSAQLLADLISGLQPSLEVSPYELRRFS